MDFPVDVARTHLAYGRCLLQAGRPLEADQQLERAAAVFANERLHGWVAHVERLRSKPSTPVVDAGLTPTEREIIGLVLQRRTNAEIARVLFMSKRTIELHLTRVFRKVGVARKSQLIELDTVRELVGPTDRSLSSPRDDPRTGQSRRRRIDTPRVAMPASTNRARDRPDHGHRGRRAGLGQEPTSVMPLSSPPGSESPPSSSSEGVVPVAVPDGAGLLDGLALGEGESVESVGVGEGLGAARLVIVTTGISASPPTGMSRSWRWPRRRRR